MLPDFSSQKEKEKYFHTLRDDQKTDVFNEMIDESEHIVFLGGAGVSTESGIPDFRSRDGLYHRKDKKFSAYKPEYLLSFDCLNRRPEVFFDYFRSKLDCRGIEPNDAHRKLAEMEQKGKLDGVITQNIDGLHQKAGSKKVLEIHGNALRSYCVSCHTDHGEDFIFENTGAIPRRPRSSAVCSRRADRRGSFSRPKAYASSKENVRAAPSP